VRGNSLAKTIDKPRNPVAASETIKYIKRRIQDTTGATGEVFENTNAL
jgi:hypothetical protein